MYIIPISIAFLGGKAFIKVVLNSTDFIGTISGLLSFPKVVKSSQTFSPNLDKLFLGL